ncbi:MAG: hypothetical protein JW709_04540 [Sedimentisphaerales bacterium]|nr:hypothetical protein [Sedimentisphaerales bacterium]
MDETKVRRNHWLHGATWLPGLLLIGCIILTTGCEQTIPGEIYRKKTVAWPIFDVEKSEGLNADGTKWQKEKGDACCWLSSWEKEKTYDNQGFLIYRKEKNAFIPIYWNEEEESKEFTYKKGAVLLIWPYESKRAKTETADASEK